MAGQDDTFYDPHRPKANPHRSPRLLRQYFETNLDPIGDLPATQLLDFFLEEIVPAVYKQATHDAQTRLADLPGELYADPVPYWPHQAAKRRR